MDQDKHVGREVARELYYQDQLDTPQMTWPAAAVLISLFILIGFGLWLWLG